MRILALPLCGLLAACSSHAPVYTLYRNSNAEMQLQGTQAIRVHWATFDATESAEDYNEINCKLAARLLNANIAKENAGQHPVKFWCERGRYHS